MQNLVCRVCISSRVEVDVVSEWARFKSQSHTLRDHFLSEVGRAEGSLAKTVNEECGRGLVSFLFDRRDKDVA